MPVGYLQATLKESSNASLCGRFQVLKLQLCLPVFLQIFKILYAYFKNSGVQLGL